MKLLFRKEQDEILKRIAACQIICNSYINELDAYAKINENLANIATTVDGCSGAEKVLNMVDSLYRR